MTDDDFRTNDFSPNDEGNAAPIHSNDRHGLQRRLISEQSNKHSQNFDEEMVEDDGESSVRFSNLETREDPYPGIDKSKIQYFGGNQSTHGPSMKLHQHIQYK